MSASEQSEQDKVAGAAAAVRGDVGGIVVRGRITDRDGKSVAGAHVAAVAWRKQETPGTDSVSEALAEAVADSAGEFVLPIPEIQPEDFYSVNVLARIDGKGLAWQKLDTDIRSTEISLTLPAEEPIRPSGSPSSRPYTACPSASSRRARVRPTARRFSRWWAEGSMILSRLRAIRSFA